MADGLTDGDRTWLETRFREIADVCRGQQSQLNDVKIDVNTLKTAAPHRCTEEIAKHEAASWAHNPYKAGGLIASIVGIVEGVKKFISH
jgi:hypothetical protein